MDLGLFVPDRTVERQGGAVDVDDDPGFGARDSLRFPDVSPIWYGFFHGLGRTVGLMVRSRAWWCTPQRGPAGTVRGARRVKRKRGLLANLTGMTEGRVVGAALAGTVETGRAMLDRASVQASLEAALLGLSGGTAELHQPVAAARRSADQIAQVLQEGRVAPDRLAVDGLPGSGKSSLARALADRLGMRWQCFDHENMNVPRDTTQPRTVYEHQRLLRTQDVDVFDALVYIDEPAAVAKARVLHRARTEGRRALIIDVLDYDKLKRIGKLAFDVCDGRQISIPDSSLLMKVMPPGGFRARANLVNRLHAAGHDVVDGMSKEQMLFLLAYGRARKGLLAYLLPGAYNEELLRGVLAGMRRYMAEGSPR